MICVVAPLFVRLSKTEESPPMRRVIETKDEVLYAAVPDYESIEERTTREMVEVVTEAQVTAF